MLVGIEVCGYIGLIIVSLFVTVTDFFEPVNFPYESVLFFFLFHCFSNRFLVGTSIVLN